MLLHTAAPFAQDLPPGLDLLREPVPALHPLKCRCQVLRMQEQVAQILPDQCIELVRGDEARGTGRFAM